MVEPVPRAIFSWCRLRNVRKSVDFPDAYRKSTIMLKVSDNCISRVDLYFVPGPTRGGYIVQIREVPRSISIAQLIVFFGKRIKRKVSTSHRYDFDFSEL